MENLKYYLPGSILILMALLIVAVPEILIALMVASMIMLGVGALYFGHLLRKSEQEWDVFNRKAFGEDLDGRNVLRRRVFRSWKQEF